MTDTADLATIVNRSPLTGDEAWFNEEADQVEGYDFIKDEALFSLIGVPFRVFTLTYRPGIQQKGTEWRNDYISSELRVYPFSVMKRQIDRILSRRSGDDFIKDPRAIPEPGEFLGVNNGSTGIYRQFTEYLENKELITLPDDLPKVGKKNDCRYDLPASMFELNEEAIREGKIEQRFTPNGESITLFRVSLDCPRGLRYSHYDNEFSGSDGAFTWYIA